MKNSTTTFLCGLLTVVALGTTTSSIVLYAKYIDSLKKIQGFNLAEHLDLLNIKSSTQKRNALIELASNNRMASIIAYHLKSGQTLESLSDSGYLATLSETLKNDFIYDNVYGRLAAYNANVEYTPLSSSKRLIREMWTVKIEIGSHFDVRPQGRLILSSESVNIPLCKATHQPYVAYVVASPVEATTAIPTVDITEESGSIPQYRFTLNSNGKLAAFDTNYRILIDVGCTPITPLKDNEQMTN